MQTMTPKRMLNLLIATLIGLAIISGAAAQTGAAPDDEGTRDSEGIAFFEDHKWPFNPGAVNLERTTDEAASSASVAALCQGEGRLDPMIRMIFEATGDSIDAYCHGAASFSQAESDAVFLESWFVGGGAPLEYSL